MGRKPFLLAAVTVGAAPACVLVLHIRLGVSLFWCDSVYDSSTYHLVQFQTGITGLYGDFSSAMCL